MSHRSPCATLGLALGALVGAMGCSGSHGGGSHGAGTTTPEPPPDGARASSEAPAPSDVDPDAPAVEGAIELTLATHDGRLLFLGDLRGRPILLYLFATFDFSSQANLNVMHIFTERHPEVLVIGVALQPDARSLLDAWVHALAPPFLATFDPDDRVARGESPLGPVSIPAFVLLDEQGVPVRSTTGILTEEQLEALVAPPPSP